MPNRDTISQLWDRVCTSLWFVPGLMALGALTLAVLAPAIDRVVPDEWLGKLPLVYSGRPTGARAVLSTIATSMITTAGVVFSMTLVSLQLASAQFGPRLLRTFLRDRGNQIVLGIFVGIFLYCILVLPTIGTTSDSAFVPHIAVTIALLLAIVGLAMLVYFIDHVAQSIHADAVIESVASELNHVIEHLFPEPVGDGKEQDAEEDLPRRIEERSRTLSSPAIGYLRFVNGDALIAIATENDLLIRIEVHPGHYVFEGDAIASVWSKASMAESAATRLGRAFVFGSHRTPLQDLLFAFEQLAEMAVRALSPGINDPTTAMHCIDRIGSSLGQFVARRLPSRLRRDDAGVVRVIADCIRVDQVLEGAVDSIARHAGAQLPVWLRLLRVLEKVHDRARRSTDRDHLRRRARRLVERAMRCIEDPVDLERIGAASMWASSDDHNA